MHISESARKHRRMIAREVGHLIAAGISARALADELNAREIPQLTAAGPWTQSRAHYVRKQILADLEAQDAEAG